MFNYGRFANNLILEATLQAGMPPMALQYMAHLFAAEHIWLCRCNGISPGDVVVWPDWTMEKINSMAGANHNAWIKYLNEITEEDLTRVIHYKTMAGQSYSSLMSDIIIHVINHGTHTRAQAGQHLKLAGTEKLPPTDYIFYVRD